MKLQSLAFLAVLVLGSSSARAVEVLDPQALLELVDGASADLPFEDAYHCGDAAKYRAGIIRITDLRCSQYGCSTRMETPTIPPLIEKKVYACETDYAEVFWEHGLTVGITRDEFVLLKGNELRMFLARMTDIIGYDGRVVIDNVELRSFPVQGPTGERITMGAYQVNAHFVPSGSHELAKGVPVFWTVLREGAGVTRLAQFHFDNRDWFKLEQRL